MLPTRELTGTSVGTSAVGFGCAGLYRTPHREVRRLTLDTAYDAGIRHFDVAPMYGLGLAEGELGAFIKHRRHEVTVTTKFGIEPTSLTRTLAPLQGAGRAVLAKYPSINRGLETSGKNADSGLVGRLLYRSSGYDHRAAQQSLERSLRALGTDYVDVFLLHDPLSGLLTDPSGLAAFLDEQCQAGRIRCWGVTGYPPKLANLLASLGWPTVVQHRDDIFDDEYAPTLDAARITYGALARALPAIRRFLGQSPSATRVWSEQIGMDLTEGSILPKMLLSVALRRNLTGPVLFSTARPERVRMAVEAETQSVRLSEVELTSVSELAAAVRMASVETIGTS